MLLFKILKRDIGQEKKLEERLVPLAFKEGDVPWILKKDDLSMVKDVILV
jgi:hypothetical protein